MFTKKQLFIGEVRILLDSYLKKDIRAKMKFPKLNYVSVEDWILSQVKGRSILHLGCAGDYLQYGAEACLHYQISKVRKKCRGSNLSY